MAGTINVIIDISHHNGNVDLVQAAAERHCRSHPQSYTRHRFY